MKQPNIPVTQSFEARTRQVVMFMMVIFCSGISCGYGLAYTNNTMPVINAIYGWDDDASKYKWDSLIGCIFTLGAGIGATSAGKIIQYGRRRAHFIACAIGTIGCGVQCIETLPALFIGRTLYGFASGILSVASNRMVDEYVPLQMFSTCAPVFSLSLNIGTLLATFSAAILPKDSQPQQVLAANQTWRIIYGLPIFFYCCVVMGMLILIKTDTPKFLMQSDSAAAAQAVKTIYMTSSDEEVDEIIRYMAKNNQSETSTSTLKETFTSPKYKRCTWVNIGSIIFHELTGINVIFLYSNTILTQILQPGSSFTPRQGVYMINIVNTIASAFAIFTIRTFGRRPLMLFGESAISLTHCLIATFILLQVDVGVLVMLCVFMAIYQNTSGPVAWVYAAETMTDVGLGVALQVLYGTVMILSLVTEPLMGSALHPSGVFYLFALFSLIGFFFVWIYFKETKGLTEKQKKQVYDKTTELGETQKPQNPDKLI